MTATTSRDELRQRLLAHFIPGLPATVPYALRVELPWARRCGFLERTGSTAGIANTRGGVQWFYVITATGQAARATFG